MRFGLLEQMKNLGLCPLEATRIQIAFDSDYFPQAYYWVGGRQMPLSVSRQHLLYVEERIGCQLKYAEKPELTLVGLTTGATAAISGDERLDKSAE